MNTHARREKSAHRRAGYTYGLISLSADILPCHPRCEFVGKGMISIYSLRFRPVTIVEAVEELAACTARAKAIGGGGGRVDELSHRDDSGEGLKASRRERCSLVAAIIADDTWRTKLHTSERTAPITRD